MISQVMISDISKYLNPKQYANQKGLSLQHYLIDMMNTILYDTDTNSEGEINAVILYDFL